MLTLNGEKRKEGGCGWCAILQRWSVPTVRFLAPLSCLVPATALICLHASCVVLAPLPSLVPATGMSCTQVVCVSLAPTPALVWCQTQFFNADDCHRDVRPGIPVPATLRTGPGIPVPATARPESCETWYTCTGHTNNPMELWHTCACAVKG